jgi:hypothetical protein
MSAERPAVLSWSDLSAEVRLELLAGHFADALANLRGRLAQVEVAPPMVRMRRDLQFYQDIIFATREDMAKLQQHLDALIHELTH